VTGDFLSLYGRSTRNAALCTLAEQLVPDLLARAAYTQVGGAFPISPGPVSNGLSPILPNIASRLAERTRCSL